MRNNGLKIRIFSAVMAAVMLSAGGVCSTLALEPGLTVNAAKGDRSFTDQFCFEEKSDGTYAVHTVYMDGQTQERIVIPDEYNGRAVTELRYDMFSHSGDTDSSFTVVIGKNISTIEANALRGINISAVEVDENNKSFSVIDGMLCSSDGKTLVFCPSSLSGKVVIPEAVEKAADGAFSCSSVTELEIGSKCRELSAVTLSDCKKLKSISVSPDNESFSSADGVLYSKDGTAVKAFPSRKGGAFVSPEKVTRIDSFAFAGAGRVTSADLTSVSVIGESAFEGCSALRSVTLYGTLKSIGRYAFYRCTSLGQPEIPDTIESVGNKAFHDTAWFNESESGFLYTGKILYGYKPGEEDISDTLSIREGTVSVADGALDGSDVRKLIIPGSLTRLTGSSMYPCYDLDTIEVNSSNSSFKVFDGVLFSKDMKRLICVPGKFRAGSYKVPDVVESIDSYAFKSNRNIEDITIYNNVTSFGSSPFFNGDEKRSVVCLKNSKAAAAAKNDNVSIVFLQTYVNLSKKTLTLGKGESYPIRATVSPDVRNNEIQWKTSDSSVATVSAGVVTATGTGTVTITATDSTGSSADCIVTVKPAPQKITLQKTSVTLGVGETMEFGSSLSSGSASASRKYTSSDKSVVSIDPDSWNCRFTAKKPGTSIITVKTYNGKTATCKVTVKPAPTSVKMSKTAISVGVGETVYLSSILSSGSGAFGRVYSTENSDIARINPTNWNCSFTGISPGTTNIKVRTYNGKTATCKVTVKAPPRFVKTEKSELSLGVGEDYSMGCVLLGTEASATRTFRTSNSTVVRMNKTSWESNFTAKNTGKAWVTAKTYNGQEGSCVVNVRKAPSSVSVDKKTLTLKVGRTANLNAALPEGTASAKRVFRTSNSSIVKMTKTQWQGGFKAVKPGTAWVTIRTYNGKEASCKVTVVS